MDKKRNCPTVPASWRNGHEPSHGDRRHQARGHKHERPTAAPKSTSGEPHLMVCVHGDREVKALRPYVAALRAGIAFGIMTHSLCETPVSTREESPQPWAVPMTNPVRVAIIRSEVRWRYFANLQRTAPHRQRGGVHGLSLNNAGPHLYDRHYRPIGARSGSGCLSACPSMSCRVPDTMYAMAVIRIAIPQAVIA